jgi:DNA-binding CsgD family transcriptional regulator
LDLTNFCCASPGAQVRTAPAEFSRELGLTSREGEVLSWLSKGKSNRDIAQILGLSPRTVDKHLEQIYAKLGVENRTAATAIAVKAAQDKSRF